jgi:hypothetical protein
VDDRVLSLLDKGHTRADFVRAVDLCRDAGVALAPTFVPFTPWISLQGYCELLRTLAELNLVDTVAPIQLAIRLLIPEGSRLLELNDLRGRIGSFDPVNLTYPWRHPDPEVDRLHMEVSKLVGVKLTRSRREVFKAVGELAFVRADLPMPSALANLDAAPPRATVPYLNEPWYC